MTLTKRGLFALLPNLAFLTFNGGGKGGGGGGRKSTTTTNKVDPAVLARYDKIFDFAEGVVANPYTPYTDQRVADFTDAQELGFDSILNASQNAGVGTLSSAVNTANQLGGFTPDLINTRALGKTLNEYQNQYTDEVIDTTLYDMERQRLMAMNDIAGAAQSGGAFGNSRHALLEAETNRAFADEFGQISAQLRDQGFTNSQQAFMDDSALQQQGDVYNQAAGFQNAGLQQNNAQLLAGLSGQQLDQGFLRGQAQLDVGSQQQQREQELLNNTYWEFLGEQEKPDRDLQRLTSTFSGAPIGQTSITRSDGGGGGGKIICTMMNESYGFGDFRNKLWLEQSRRLDPAIERGYHTIFLPVIAFAKGDGWMSRMARKIMEHGARHRTADIWKQKRGKRDRIGQAYRLVFEPICYVVGKLIKEK
jgi:hypothetical protein